MSFVHSFIIPHKNNPELLQRCIDSIPNRSDIQIIVVDDKSDYEKKIALMHENLEIIQLDENRSKGAGRARNVGLARVMAKWILFTDAGDFYDLGFMNVLDSYSFMKKFFENCDGSVRSVNKICVPLFHGIK